MLGERFKLNGNSFLALLFFASLTLGDETRIVLLGILAAAMWAKLPTFRYCMFFLFFISLQPEFYDN